MADKQAPEAFHFPEVASIDTPDAGYVAVAAKSADKKVYSKDSTGTETELGGGSVSQLSDLSDVGVTTPTNQNFLVADGDSWESRALVVADVSDAGDLAALDTVSSTEIDDDAVTLAKIADSSASSDDTLRYISGNWSVIKNNVSASSPTVNDDNTAGYSQWSLWLDTTKQRVSVCLDATTGAANWVDTTVQTLVQSVFGRDGVVAAAADDYAASYITNDSGVSGSYVDDALDGLDSRVTTLEGASGGFSTITDYVGSYLTSSSIDTTSSTYADCDGTNIKQTISLSGGETVIAWCFISLVKQVTGGTGSFKLVAGSTDADSVMEVTNQGTGSGEGILLGGIWTGLGSGSFDIKPQFKTSANTCRIQSPVPISWHVTVYS